MSRIKIIDGYFYSCDCNIIINEEIKSLDLNSEKIDLKKIEINSDLINESLKRISQITFEVTHNCNLRCKYCINGDHYFFERKISKQNMKFEIAKRGLEYFFENIKDRMNKSLSIGFFGGEPLLAMGVIKKIVNYSKELFKNWDLRYTLTTNGTIMTSEIIDFLIENSFSLLVSLDGPKEIHDKKRVYANNDGSYEKVMNNLIEISKVNEKYFKKKVRLNVVFSKDLPIIDRIDFFLETPLLNELYASGSFVNYMDNDYYKINTYDEDRFFYEISTIKKNIKSKLLKQKKLKSIEIFFEKMLKLNGLNQKRFTNLWGACVLAKPLIDVNGYIHFCDKINDKFSFGDVFQGVDFRKLENIINSFIDVNTKYCSSCDLRFLCNRCYIQFGKNGVLKFDKEFCKKQKGVILDRLKEYVTFNVDYIKTQTQNKTNDVGKRYKFHQFVFVESGPVNSSIIDLLKGNVYQVENKYIEQFESHQQSLADDFIKSLKEEQLIIEVDQDTWIPKLENNTFISEMMKKIHRNYFELEIEDGLDFELIKQKFDMSSIFKLTYYGNKKIDDIFCSVPIIYKEKNFNACLTLSKVNGNFKKNAKEYYFLNMNQNSCWARKIAVTNDGKIRPCIHSNIVIGNINEDEDIQSVVEKSREYWDINKDKVEKCKNCELRYICFDCREIAQRNSNGNLYATNPHCNYDPYTGKWVEK